MDKIDDETRNVAMKLARQDRYSPDAMIHVADSFSVAIWLTYVSRARILIAERAAFGK